MKTSKKNIGIMKQNNADAYESSISRDSEYFSSPPKPSPNLHGTFNLNVDHIM